MGLPLTTIIEKFGKPLYLFQIQVGSRHTVIRRAFVEGLDVTLADRYAVRCGYHPVEVWGYEEWLKALENEVK